MHITDTLSSSPMCRERFFNRFHKLSRLLQQKPLFLHFCMIFVYRLCLDAVYICQLSPVFAYAGFTTDIRFGSYLLSLAAAVLFALLMAQLHRDERPSGRILLFLGYLCFIPLTSYYGCKGCSISFLGCVAAYWTLVCMWQKLLPTLQLRPLTPKHSRLVFTLITIGATAIVLYVSGKYTNFRLLFDWLNVDDVRAEAAAYSLNSFLNYCLSGMPIILSVCVLYWLQEKKYVISALLLGVFFLYFSISGHRAVFLFVILLMGCWLLYRDWMLQYAAGLLTLGVAGTAVLSSAGIVMPMSLLVRRMMYDPIRITENYSLFFQTHPLNLFRHGLMGKFGFDEVYSTSIPCLLGEYDYTYSSENNGLLGDLYANLPVLLGLLLMPLILIICFRLLDLVSKQLPSKLVISFCVFFAESFINSSWSVVLLSHGFLLACLFLYLFPRKEPLS